MIPGKEFGVHTENPEKLKQCYRISEGLLLLDPDEAERKGYAPRELRSAVTIPRVDEHRSYASLREPTDIELADMAATPSTKRVMQILRLGRGIVQEFRERCLEAERRNLGERAVRQELLPGLWCLPRAVRLDQPGELNVSMSQIYPGKKVGDHIDEWSNPEASFVIANMGPGERWHRVAPDINRSITGGPKHHQRAAYIANHPDSETISVHWFKLEPPQDDFVEAIVNSPVAWALHDGSTIENGGMPSEAVMGVTYPGWQEQYQRPV